MLSYYFGLKPDDVEQMDIPTFNNYIAFLDGLLKRGE